MADEWQIAEGLTAAQLGWAAGIIDGEGCIGIYRRSGRTSTNGRGMSLLVSVGNCDIRMPVRLKEMFGGNVARLTSPSRGEKRSPAWQWSCTGRHAGRIMEILLPFSVIKKEQMEVAIAFASTMGKRGTNGPLPSSVLEKRVILFDEARRLKIRSGRGQ